ncbi:MAG: STAS domain-containing protein [Mycobacteriales bacterium]|nr:STAS domain-containing protein [Frankia sp.]
MRTLEASVRERDGVGVIDLSGDVNGSAAEALEAAYDEAIASGPRRVLLNFADVDYINSTGIALIVGVLARARTEGRAVQACGLTDHYKEIFEITRLADFMQMFDEEDAAVASVGAGRARKR